MKVYRVDEPEFAEYGRIIRDCPADGLMQLLAARDCPENTVRYEPSDSEMEDLPEAQVFAEQLFGHMPIQIGWTNGHCRKMNALEYHRSSEINIPDQDIILFLARRQDLDENFSMNTDQVKAFLLPKGVMAEIYATTLHYAPCQTSEAGYRCIVVLPAGTNRDLPIDEEAEGEKRLITATNKWLIGHPDGQCGKGTFIGLTGPNPEV
jgi:hypothetical protein